jgi:hypothetical protein
MKEKLHTQLFAALFSSSWLGELETNDPILPDCSTQQSSSKIIRETPPIPYREIIIIFPTISENLIGCNFVSLAMTIMQFLKPVM